MPSPTRGEARTYHKLPNVPPLAAGPNAMQRQPNGETDGEEQQDDRPGGEVKQAQGHKDGHPRIKEEETGRRLSGSPMVRVGLH